MIEYLNHIDTQLFLFLNGLHSPFLDFVLEKATHAKTWIPLYLLIVSTLIYKFRINGLKLVVIILLTLGFCDQFSSRIVKPLSERPRPCKNEVVATQARLLVGCNSPYGYFSSHASNTFALATLLALIFYKKHKSILLLIPWAAVVSYSRIYVGVHYPGDVLSGMLFGIICAFIAYKLIQRYWHTTLQIFQS